MVSQHAPAFGGFLQSWEWGEFQRRNGRSVERIDHVDESGRTIAQAIRMPLPLGQSYWSVPKGPIGKASLDRQIEVLRERLPGAMFMRVEPSMQSSLMQVKDVQPSTTLMLDLSSGQEAILAQMKSKTRYNIRLSEKKQVEAKIVGLDHFEDFVRLMKQTTTRDQFRSFPEKYYRKMLEVVQGEGANAFLAMAFYEGRPLVGNVMVDFAGVRTYLHGASSNLHRNVMAPYWLQWFLIKDAAEKGMMKFDFWGIAPEDAGEDHPWQGITRYKRGFGGEVVSMPGTFDLPMRHLWYGLYKGVKRLRSPKSVK